MLDRSMRFVEGRFISAISPNWVNDEKDSVASERQVRLHDIL
jgi:hypothetical protein